MKHSTDQSCSRPRALATKYRIRYSATADRRKGATTIIGDFATHAEAEAAMNEEKADRAGEKGLSAERGGAGSVWWIQEVSVARQIAGRVAAVAIGAGLVTLAGYSVAAYRDPPPHVTDDADRAAVQQLNAYDEKRGTDLMGLCELELGVHAKYDSEGGDPKVALVCSHLLHEGYVSDYDYAQAGFQCLDAHGGDDKSCEQLPVSPGGTRGSPVAVNLAVIDKALKDYCARHPASAIPACRSNSSD
jgi:hypothetical protein